MIKGLHHRKELLSRDLLTLRARARRPETDPRTAHEAGVAADGVERELHQVTATIASDVELVGEIQQQINYLSESSFKSAHRTLALRHLEDAQSRLLRELGDLP